MHNHIHKYGHKHKEIYLLNIFGEDEKFLVSVHAISALKGNSRLQVQILQKSTCQSTRDGE